MRNFWPAPQFRRGLIRVFAISGAALAIGGIDHHISIGSAAAGAKTKKDCADKPVAEGH
jgi:hypothetical protein